MDFTSIFAAVETAQTALGTGTQQLVLDQNKQTALALAVSADTANVATLTTASDVAINAAILALQQNLSTFVPPVVDPPAPPSA